ncbi:MAG: phosphoglycerate kinase [Patescibacteria group bacterium]|nr:phosphoglycerate kinase [Patescibacteria group bacterium]
MKTLKDIPHLQGVKVMVRADFNVPVRNGVVADGFRIKSTLPTIDFLRKSGARIILVSHLESADGKNESLQPIAEHLNGLGVPISFVKDWRTANQIIGELKDGECALLENVRLFEGEKENASRFAQELASLADIYVNDAFSVSHREHASIVGVPRYLPSYAGFQLEKEIANLSKAFHPSHPFLFILGGAKFETKLPLLAKFMQIADSIFVGGALANDFFAAKGYEIGVSLVSKGKIDLSPYADDPKLHIPLDVMTKENAIKDPDKLDKSDQIVDSGPKTLEALGKMIAGAKFILWNGPLGIYEDGYRGPTLDLAKLVSLATKNGATTIVGGGDTLAAIDTLGLLNGFTFISTGGGAMLDFLAKGTLPGIKALEDAGNK